MSLINRYKSKNLIGNKHVTIVTLQDHRSRNEEGG